MKISFLYITIIFAFIISCNTKKDDKSDTDKVMIENTSNNDLEGYNLLKSNCYACHSITAKSHDDIIAPPMVAVKRRYLISYTTEEEFIEAMTDWVMDPLEENALMRGAVMQFNVMPKQPFNKNDIIKISKYIYNNELEKPSWFDAHFNEEHPNGMGMGNGRGRGRYRN